MKILKRLLALSLSIVISISLTSCSIATWSFKTSDTTLSAGTYILYMSQAYSEAGQKLQYTSTNILKQDIDGEKVSKWIKDEAKKSCEKLIGVEQKFDELGLSLTDEENQEAVNNTDSIWTSYGKSYEKLGVSKESFHRAYTLYNIKYEKVFDTIYGKDGTNAISDDELQPYFIENFTSYSYFSKQLPDSVYESEDSSNESSESENIKNHFDKYAEEINNNGSTFYDIVSQYKNDFSTEEDPIISNFFSTNTNSKYYETSFISENLKDLEVFKAVSASDGTFQYLIYKDDSSNRFSSLSDEDKKSILLDMKSDDFDNMLIETAENDNLKTNYYVIHKYKPSMFVSKNK